MMSYPTDDHDIRPYLIRDDFEEKGSALEPYDRAWNLLKYLKYVTTAKDLWASRFADPETWILGHAYDICPNCA